MNIPNLQKMADHIRTVPQELFDMNDFREIGSNNWRTPECKSIGCIIGHCTILDSDNIKENFTDNDGDIIFDFWSVNYTGIASSSPEWVWCFGVSWVRTDNTPEGAALRIEWFVKKGVPENWYAQMYGSAKLCYLKK